MEFGKFRGHTLGEIAAFEPSYIDWISSTISRDADLVAAARAIAADLDRRGIVRRRRETDRQLRDRERRRREWQRIFATGRSSQPDRAPAPRAERDRRKTGPDPTIAPR